MNKKLLLLPVVMFFITALHAQQSRSAGTYAITASSKGQHDWKEVRLIDVKTGKEIESVFSSKQEPEILNARTGKPVQKKDELAKAAGERNSKIQVYTLDANNNTKRVTSQAELDKLQAAGSARGTGNKVMFIKERHFTGQHQGYDKPFATNSAAMAYDKKHGRLYYTPLGINQLRYIDIKSKTAKIYYFEDEAFGVVQGPWDAAAQITRMVIAADGNGYALSNDANHLIKFTTGKKPIITDLGVITDDASNEDFSIHRGMGGDMIADKDGNLYLITAYKNVWKINIETKIAVYKGGIKGLPENYQTNGAAVEGGSKIIVCSSRSTDGYYRFDLETLQAEKIASEGEVYNASDLANANLAFVKEEKEEKKKEQAETATETIVGNTASPVEEVKNGDINVYPNPVTDGVVKISFRNQPNGKYNVQVLDLSGRIISSTAVIVNMKAQVLELRLPASLARGNYLVKVTGEGGTNTFTTTMNVQ